MLSGPKKRDFVVLTLEQFNSMEETAHLLSTKANTERLLESIAQDRAGNVTVKQLDLGEKPLRPQKRKLVSAAAVNSAAKKKK
ncbi:MAG TPA: type II toxin-antitoxin system Phd/YefM family antitoxin [Cyclobacteriaceae bacterium]|nr:type II toxin-antitoxin system Phd/YefM family antitoxin [Cyclobacteriaceae bacterium]